MDGKRQMTVIEEEEFEVSEVVSPQSQSLTKKQRIFFSADQEPLGIRLSSREGLPSDDSDQFRLRSKSLTFNDSSINESQK